MCIWHTAAYADSTDAASALSSPQKKLCKPCIADPGLLLCVTGALLLGVSHVLLDAERLSGLIAGVCVLACYIHLWHAVTFLAVHQGAECMFYMRCDRVGEGVKAATGV